MDNIKKEHFKLDSLKERIENDEDLLNTLLGMVEGSFNEFLDELRNEIHSKNFQGIKNSAHKIKGSAANMCFPILTRLGKEMEEMQTFNDSEIDRMFKEIETEIKYLISIV